MALRYYYANTATTVLDITARCRLYRTSVKSSAEEGESSLSTLIIDDPDGDLVILPFRRIYIKETTAPVGSQVVYNGYVSNRDIRRGPYRVGAGREWVVQLSDPNWLIGLRIVVGSDGNRPAEDDYTRIRWLLTTTEANTFNGSLTYVSSTATRISMDAVDYRGQSVTSILDDCAQASGKNWWVVYFESLGQYGLWYDFADSTVYSSTLWLSNTLTDIDSATSFPISEENTTLERSPSRLVSGVYLPYDGGWVYRQDTAVGAQYIYRDVAAPSVNVKTETKAVARALRYLGDNDTEEDVIRTEVVLPAASVNGIMHGMRVQLKASHLPDYETVRWLRVLNRTVTETSEEHLTVALELSPVAVAPEIEQYYTSDSSLFDCINSSWPSQPSANLGIAFIAARDGGVGNDANYALTAVAVGNTAGAGVCDDTLDIAGTEWTFVRSISTSNGVGQTSVAAMDWRNMVVGEPQTVRWRDSGALPLGRPRVHYVEVSGLSGAPTVVASAATGLFGGDPGSVFTSPNIVTTGAGYIFAGFDYRCTGPSDGSSASFTMAARSPAVDLTQGFCSANFGGYSWFGYLHVDSAGTYNIVLDRSTAPRASHGHGWIMGFWPQ